MAVGNIVACSGISYIFNRSLCGVKLPRACSVRWKKEPKRKPMWLPPAPSKLFRIPKKPDISHEEWKQITELYMYYRSHLKSIRNFLIEEYHKTTDVGAEAVEQAKKEEIEHERMMEKNRKENERIAQLRNDRLAHELEEEMEQLLKLNSDAERQKQEMKQKAEELVLMEKEKSASFINKETLEKAIEHALDNPVNYNFSIDLNGNKYWETESPQ